MDPKTASKHVPSRVTSESRVAGRASALPPPIPRPRTHAERRKVPRRSTLSPTRRRAA